MDGSKLVRRQRACRHFDFIAKSVNDNEMTSPTVITPRKYAFACSGSRSKHKKHLGMKEGRRVTSNRIIFQEPNNKPINFFKEIADKTSNSVDVTLADEDSVTRQLLVDDFEIYLVSKTETNSDPYPINIEDRKDVKTANPTEVPRKSGRWVSNIDNDDISSVEKVESETASTFDCIDLSSNDSEYDTDIEEEFPVEPSKPFDTTGASLYRKECFKAKIIPLRNLLNQLHTDRIELRYAGLGGKGSVALSKALAVNQNIREVDLSENDMKVDGGEAFVNMLYENRFITTVNLSDNHLLPDIGVKIAKMLLVNKTLKMIILKGNGFTDRVARAFAETLKINNALILLDLSYNEFSEQGGLYLGVGLGANRCLQNLNLQWNSIRGKGAVSIAAALKTNKNLTNLNLSWNGISLIGCIAFGTYLKRNKTLKILDISNNRIGTYGTRKISPALTVHPMLQTLKIGLNSIGDEGAVNILNAVKKNKSLKLLDLQDVTISDSTNEIINELQKRRDIKIVTGGLGGFTKGTPPPSGMDVLVQFMQDHRLRLTDVFSQWDKDKSADISKKEMKHGVKETGLNMDMHQLRNLVDQLDGNLDGSIDFREIVAGRQTVLIERRFQKKVAIRTEEREKQSIQLPHIINL